MAKTGALLLHAVFMLQMSLQDGRSTVRFYFQTPEQTIFAIASINQSMISEHNS